MRIWEAGGAVQLGTPLTGHTGWVTAVALGRIGEREVIVSGSRDQTVRIWDAVSGQQLGAPMTGHTDWVRAVDLHRVGDREVPSQGFWKR